MPDPKPRRPAAKSDGGIYVHVENNSGAPHHTAPPIQPPHGPAQHMDEAALVERITTRVQTATAEALNAVREHLLGVINGPTIKGVIDSLSSSMEEIVRRLGLVETKASQNETAIETLKTESQREIAELARRVAAEEGRVIPPDLSADVATLETDRDAHGRMLTDYEGRVTALEGRVAPINFAPELQGLRREMRIGGAVLGALTLLALLLAGVALYRSGHVVEKQVAEKASVVVGGSVPVDVNQLLSTIQGRLDKLEVRAQVDPTLAKEVADLKLQLDALKARPALSPTPSSGPTWGYEITIKTPE